MANVGDLRAVGSPAQDTGRYGHSACADAKIFEKGDILAPCPNRGCPNKGANWVLQEKLPLKPDQGETKAPAEKGAGASTAGPTER